MDLIQMKDSYAHMRESMESISAFSCRVQLRLVLPFASCSPILTLFKRRVPRFPFNLRRFGTSGLGDGQHTGDAGSRLCV